MAPQSFCPIMLALNLIDFKVPPKVRLHSFGTKMGDKQWPAPKQMCNRLTNSPTHNGQKPSTLCRIDPVEGAWKNPQNTSPEQKLKTKTKLTSNASQSS